MSKTLFQFQKDALNKIAKNKNAALYWDMGTGKTYSSICLSNYWNSEILIVLVLKSTTKQWIKELEEETDRKVFNGYKKTKKDGIKCFIDYEGKKALVIGYDAYKAKSSRDLIRYINKNSDKVTIICDESQLIGHDTSLRTKAVMNTRSFHKLFLSGTPAAGGKMENLISNLKCLGVDITFEQFLKDYCYTREWINPAMPWKKMTFITGYHDIDKLKNTLVKHGASFLTKEQAGVELPEAQDVLIYQDATSNYKTFMKRDLIELDDETTLKGDNSLTKLLYARQLCSIYDKSRAEAVKDLLQQADGEMVVIFYNFNKEYEILKGICKELKRPICTVNGQKKDLSNYEKGERNTVILGQYQACSAGLNLQKARITIFNSLPLSYSDYEQAKARTHRIGQNRGCLFYHMLSENTVEEKILETLMERKDYTVQLFN